MNCTGPSEESPPPGTTPLDTKSLRPAATEELHTTAS